MRKHTPGKWSVETVPTSIGYCHKIMPMKACLYDDSRWEGQEGEQLANAERIVSCVNALEGLNPEGVEKAIEALKHILRTKDQFGKDRKLHGTLFLTSEEVAQGEEALEALGVKL